MSTDIIKVLIVDDSEQDALLVQAALSRSGTPVFNTEWAQNVEPALFLMTTHPYDVCLIDLNLSGKSGVDLMNKAREQGCKAAMIILTGENREDAEMAALQSGASDYIVKGKCDHDVLQRVIRHALYRSRVESELRLARENLEAQVEARTAELCNAIAALQDEMEQREIAERHVREAEARYRIIFEEAMDAIILLSHPQGNFVDFNNQAFRQLGYTRDEFRTLALRDIEARETPEQVQNHIAHILANGADVFETTHRTKQGEIRNVLVSARPIDLHGTLYVLTIFHDVTERKQIEEKLRAAVIRLERHNVAKSEFVTNVSHELKTPLTSMMYGIHNLLRGIAGPLPDHAVRYLKLFDTECQRLVNTINDILDLSKIENKALTLSSITTPLGHLVMRCMDALRPHAEAAGITFTYSLDPHPIFVRCDPNLIQRVLQNILGNAIKFTPRGGSIILTTAPDPSDTGFARVSVTDSGVGIPREALDRVTERYFRANNQASGSGLGLAISKDIMTLHGGRLTVASPPPAREQGTEITITLPLAEAPTVLVGDDDPVIQDLLRLHLESHGYHVTTADSGQEVILMANANRPDLILLDLIMEDIHGTTVILSLRGSQTIRYIPIIAITGATLDEATSNILSRFSIPTLPKPWNVAELMETIETALMGMTAFQTPSTQESPP